MGARAVGLLAGVYLGAICLRPSLAWSQSDSAHPPAVLDAKPIGKAVTVTGSAHIEHVAAIIVEANLPSGAGGQTKVGDLIYRNDVIQTGVDGALGLTVYDGSSLNLSRTVSI